MTLTFEDIRYSDTVQKFLDRKHQLFIDGEWTDSASGQTIEVVDPATEKIVANVCRANSEDIDKAVKAARRAFEGPWSKLSVSERGRLIWKLADLIEVNAEEFAELESIDNGKPISVARVADVPLSVDMFRYMAGWATKIEGSTIPISVPYAPGAEFFTYTRREAVGVVAQIIPWNFPLLMAAWKLAPALAAGCTVILKPAEQTPLSGLRLADLFEQAGFPPGVVNILTGYGKEAGAPLAAHPGVDKVAFTGSTEVGRQIVAAAGSSNLKKVSLELGGKSPTIVFSDAQRDLAIEGAASAIFFNHGQCCAAGSRLFVQKDAFDEVVGGVAEQAKSIKLGHGLNESTEMGPVVSSVQLNRVCDFLKSGQNEGARALSGGGRAGETGYFVEPTVLVDTHPNMRVVREEIFGPVVVASPFDDIEDLVAQANNTNYGLASGIWTSDLSKAHRIAHRLKAGTVWINCHNVFDAALPFGGYKESGWGREMGAEVLNNYTEVKAVTIKID